MRSTPGNNVTRMNSPFFVISISVTLLAITFCNVPNEVNAEDAEPVLNFYVERELLGHSDDVTALAWSSNGQWIASGSLDNTTRIWGTGTWSNIKTLYHSAPVRGISWSRNTFKLAISHGNGPIEIWNSMTWTLIQNLSEHVDTVLGVNWKPDETQLSTGDNSGNIKIWDTTTWNSVQTLGMPDGVKDLQWSYNGDKLAACSSDGTISVWETSTWTNLQSFDATAGDQNIESIAWSPDDSKLASSSGENEVKIWDASSWITSQNLDAESPMKVSWSSDDSYVAVSVIRGIKVWETTAWEVVKTTNLSENSQIVALSIDPEAEMMVSGSPNDTNNTLLIWGKNFSPILDPIGDLTATEDEVNTYLISASDDDQVIFSDDTPLFDIDPESGQISFTPTNDDVGEYMVNISVSDGKGGVDSEMLTVIVINVDDPPEPVIKWHYGADYINITLRVGGQIGNSVTLEIEEDESLINEIIIERESGNFDEQEVHLSMNLSRSYEAVLKYSGNIGENPVSVTMERGGFAFTKHLSFDSELGTELTENLQMSDFFKAMGLIVFDATASIDIDSKIVKYFWDFGDSNLGESANVVHTYSENGIYRVNLTVESDNGIKNSEMTDVSLFEIPDKEVLEFQLRNELTLEYLYSTDQRAVFLDNRSHLRLIDSQGKTSGYIDDSYKFEIEGVYLAYSLKSGEVYYLPNDLKITYNIADTEEAYDLYIIIPNKILTKIISFSSEGGVDTLELDEEGNTLIIYTEKMEKEYSLRLEVEGVLWKGAFTLTNVNISSIDKHHYFINNWEDLTTDAKAVTMGIDKGSDGKIDLSIDLRNGMTGEEIEFIIMKKGQSDSSLLTTSLILLIVGFVSIAGIGCLIGSTEVGKLALLSIILPLYTRIKKEEVLDNEIRGMIRGYIIANPGDNYNSIKRALGLNNGTLAHHLKVLEKAEIIQSKQDGMFKRFYPAGMRIPHDNGSEISEMQRILLVKIADSPGISQKEIAKLLGMSKGVINYHVKVLHGKQLLQMKKRGRKTHCYVNSKVVKRINNTHENKINEV
ncbi:MAG: winged helix-turn-helix transcriptional regulator [Thermoplasmata archaeon]|nr:MAG: winged helix-turn-helix transcriptional regulator [Thermoplasmata archaeon]